MCLCVAANPDVCTAKRHEVSINLAGLLGGCTCPCHVTDNGALLPTRQWLHNKQQQINRRVVVLVQDEEKHAEN